jgi:hypothetical protein
LPLALADPVRTQCCVGSISQLLCSDHARLDGLLERAVRDPHALDQVAFAEFRAGLLRHIAMEEKVLLPEVRLRSGKPFARARQLRADHATLAVLMVPPPTHAIVALIRSVLVEHNPLEEDPGGLYALCEQLAGDDCDLVMERLRATPEVPLAPHLERASVYEHIQDLLDARRRVSE